MATRTPVIEYAPNGQSHAVAVTWSGLLKSSDDVGAAFEGIHYADRSVQVTGTFGSAGSVSIEGSNDGANWAALNDAQGNPLAVSLARISIIQEMTRYVRPKVIAGDATTSLVVTLLARRQGL